MIEYQARDVHLPVRVSDSVVCLCHCEHFIALEQDPDVSIRSKDEDDLPPLERARRRRSMMVGRT